MVLCRLMRLKPRGLQYNDRGDCNPNCKLNNISLKAPWGKWLETQVFVQYLHMNSTCLGLVDWLRNGLVQFYGF